MSAPAVYGLTRMQRDMLLVIQELIALDGYAPSYDGIAHELGLASKGRIAEVLTALKQRGHIDYQPRRPRSIIVLQPIPFPDECEIELTAEGAFLACASPEAVAEFTQ